MAATNILSITPQSTNAAEDSLSLSAALKRQFFPMSLALVLILFAFLPATGIAAPELSSNSTLSTAGYFTLHWSAAPTEVNENLEFELQQANNPDFDNAVTRYQGSDKASIISGLANQTYYYRVRLGNQDDWSSTLAVEVKHHSLARAFGFFGLGIVMFLMTVTVLLKGARQNPHHDSA